MIEADSLEQVQGRSIYPIVLEKYRGELQMNASQGESGVLEFEIVDWRERIVG